MNIKSSPLVHDALEAKRPTRWWIAMVVVLPLVIFVPLFTLGTLTSFVTQPGSFLAQASEALTFAATLLLLVLWVVFKEKRPFGSVGFRGPRKVPRVLVGLVGGIATMALIAVALVGLGVFRFGGSNPTTTGVAAILPALLLLLVVFVQGTTEEAVFRGYFLQVTGSQLGAWPALLAGAVIFAVLHPTSNPFALANIVLVALFFSFVSLAQGSIWTAAGFHVGWNWAQGNLLGVPVSGLPRDVAILAIGPTKGAAWWLSGAEFGIEGSALATAVLAALVVGSFYYYRRVETRRQAEAVASV